MTTPSRRIVALVFLGLIRPSSPNDETQCGLWLAPSSIPGAGLGMYAGRNYSKGSSLGFTGDVVIPIVDIGHHYNKKYEDDGWAFLWDEYTWNGESLCMEHEAYFREVNGASPGFGAAANCMLDLINVKEHAPEHGTANLHRSKDPGVGAFTYYHNRKSDANQDIPAGQELFVGYGDSWFEGREMLGPIPLSGDTAKANKLFKKFHELEQTHPQVSPSLWKNLWDTFVKDTAWKETSRVIGAFHHDDPDEWEKLHANYNLKDIRVQQSTRTMDWLQEHGACADNLKANRSTLVQAGRGAFATRHLSKGDMVAHMPLIHIANSSVLEMFHVENRTIPKQDKKFLTHQLLLNYCFGHEESTLLLCPYSPMVMLINHKKDGANVRLQWSTMGNHQDELLEQPISAFEKDARAKLAMDLIALRDIAPDEEIFLDYGHAWERAWQDHVETWEPVKGADEYLSAFDMKKRVLLGHDETHEYVKEDGTLMTEFELVTRNKSYPRNVDLRCDIEFLRNIRADVLQEDGRYEYVDLDVRKYVPCEILRMKKDRRGNTLYTAIGTYQENDWNFNPEKQEPDVLLPDVPKMAFSFFDRPYTSDLFLPNAFRHAPGVPDDLFPDAWKNLRKEATTS